MALIAQILVAVSLSRQSHTGTHLIERGCILLKLCLHQQHIGKTEDDDVLKVVQLIVGTGIGIEFLVEIDAAHIAVGICLQVIEG